MAGTAGACSCMHHPGAVQTWRTMKYHHIAMLAAALWFAAAGGASAQSTGDSAVPARGAIYGEIAGFLLLGNVSFNYEYFLGGHFSLRGGIGCGYLIEIADDFHTSVGGLAMVNYFTGGEHKFEFGLGAMYSLPGRDPLNNINPAPAISIGYRYQPASKGNFFRAGITYDSRYGVPFQLSWGRTF